MLKEHLVILFTCYLMTNLFLIPIIVVHLSGLMRRVSISRQVRVHKWTVVLLLLCPIFIYAYSVPLQILDIAGTHGEALIETGRPGLQDHLAETTDHRPVSTLSDSYLLLPVHTKSIVLDTMYFIVEYLLLITLFGFIYLLFRLGGQSYFLRQIDKHCQRRKSFKNLEIIVSSTLTLPFSVRWLKRKVYLPDLYSKKQKQIIINHEMNHFRKNHHMWTLLEALIHYLFWYNPISFYLRIKGTLLREMECDELTLKKTDRFVYSKLLITLAESQRAESRRLGANYYLNIQNCISRHTLKKRIEHMLNKPISKKSVGVSVSIALAFILSALSIFYYGTVNDQNSQADILNRIKIKYAETLTNRKGVELSKVPQNFIDALLVSQDRDFFAHKGIKLYNIVKAAVYNIFHDRQHWLGASTITQQLAKQFLDEPWEKTLGRKFRELKFTKVLEKNFTKPDILEMYLNSIFFGNSAWGLNQAAQTYFGHSYEKLTLKESTLLVQSLVAPSKYNTIEDPILARARQGRLIKSMVALGVVARDDEE